MSRPDSLGGDESLQFLEFDSPPADPVGLVREWFAGAEEYGVREPRAATLSTADADGRVSARTVLIIGVDETGLLFSTDSQSLKGRNLAANPAASVTFYWRETLQQLRVSGVASRLGADESDRLFDGRTLEARAATAVSHQGEPLTSEVELDAAVQQLLEAGDPVLRPSSWFGYRVVPEHIEFWHGRTNRLHRRLHYTRDAAGWRHERLQP